MTILNLKKHWIFNLDHCIIAGGFLRDSVLGVQPDDIDIYVTPENKVVLLNQLRPRLAAKLKSVPNSIGGTIKKVRDYDHITIEINEIEKYRTWHGDMLEVIVTPDAITVQDIIKSFDYTVNSAGWTKEIGFICHTYFFFHLWHMKLEPVLNSREIPEFRKNHMLAKGFR